MKDEFSVRLSVLQNVANDESTYHRSLGIYSMRVSNVKRSLSYMAYRYNGLADSLDKIAERIDEDKNSMKKMEEAMISVKTLYLQTENEVSGSSVAINSLAQLNWDSAQNVLASVSGDVGVESALLPIFTVTEKKQVAIGGFDKKIELFDKKYGKPYAKSYIFGSSSDVENESKKSNSSGKLKQEIADGIVIFKAENEWEFKAGLWNGSVGEADGSCGHAEINAGVIHAEDELKISAGSILLSAGMSVCALQMKADGRLGSEELNVHGSAEIELGSISVEGEIKGGFINEEGEMDLSLNAELAAELVLAKAEAEAGATIGGAEINAKGAVGFGMGAHAEVGFDDGILKVDVGAYVGLGVETSIEIDMEGLCGEAIEAVTDVTSALVDYGEDIMDIAVDATDEFLNATGEFFEDIFS